MRILLLCDHYPDSYRHGLLLRVLHLAKRIQARHQLDLLCYHDGPIEGEPKEIFGHIWTVPRPVRQAARGLLAPLTDWNPRALCPRSAGVEQLLGEEISPEDYDVVWDAGANMFLHLPPRWDRVPLVADLVDDMVLTFWRAMLSTQGLMAKMRTLKCVGINVLYERHCMRRAAHCVVVSEDDAAVFRKVSPKVPVSVIPNGVDIDFFTPGTSATVPGRLVFEGAMAFPPNQQAAVFLVNQIMPLIWAKKPSATLTLVGRDPPPEILALANDRIFVTGAVEDIRPYVREAEVFVCPLQSGAGIKNKLLQAWAMELAVVATPISIGGLGAIDEVNLLISDGVEEIAAAVLNLLGNSEKRVQLGREGRRWVASSFSWARQADVLDSLFLDFEHQKTD